MNINDDLSEYISSKDKYNLIRQKCSKLTLIECNEIQNLLDIINNVIEERIIEINSLPYLDNKQNT